MLALNRKDRWEAGRTRCRCINRQEGWVDSSPFSCANASSDTHAISPRPEAQKRTLSGRAQDIVKSRTKDSLSTASFTSALSHATSQFGDENESPGSAASPNPMTDFASATQAQLVQYRDRALHPQGDVLGPWPPLRTPLASHTQNVLY